MSGKHLSGKSKTKLFGLRTGISTDEMKTPRAVNRKHSHSTLGVLLRCIVAVLLAAIVLLNVFTYLLSIVNYYGDSMEPELSSGDILVVSRTQKVEEGDIIAFYYNNKVLVRRVICTGGKRISIAADGMVSINGEPLTEDYVSAPTTGQCNIEFPFSVPLDHVFVMGDNREISMDSRLEEIGTVSTDRIIGKVLFSI